MNIFSFLFINLFLLFIFVLRVKNFSVLGLAGFNIRGQTIHSELNIHPSASGDLIYTPIAPMRYEDIRSRFSRALLVIVDEVNCRFFRIFIVSRFGCFEDYCGLISINTVKPRV